MAMKASAKTLRLFIAAAISAAIGLLIYAFLFQWMRWAYEGHLVRWRVSVAGAVFFSLLYYGSRWLISKAKH